MPSPEALEGLSKLVSDFDSFETLTRLYWKPEETGYTFNELNQLLFRLVIHIKQLQLEVLRLEQIVTPKMEDLLNG